MTSTLPTLPLRHFDNSLLHLALRAIYAAVYHDDINEVDVVAINVDFIHDFKSVCRLNDHEWLLRSNVFGADISLEEARRVTEFVELADGIIDSYCGIEDTPDSEADRFDDLAESFGFFGNDAEFLFNEQDQSDWENNSEAVEFLVESILDHHATL